MGHSGSGDISRDIGSRDIQVVGTFKWWGHSGSGDIQVVGTFR